MTYTKPFVFIAFLFSFFTIAQVVHAENPPVRAELVTEAFSVEEGTGRFSLKIGMEKGWKVYGAPEKGDTLTYPPEISWEGSENLQEAKLTWPLPKEHRENQEISHAYKEPFTVLGEITAKKPSQAVFLKGKIKLLACATLCLPLEIPFSLQLSRTVNPVSKEALSLPFILLLALAGGLVLNIMPCVLPVLGLKFFSFSTQKKPVSHKKLQHNFLLTACGIYVSFLVLALATISLKALDETVGWGIHFQNPYFLAAMVVGLFLFTASLWGVVEFHPPKWLHRFLKKTHHLEGSAAFSSGVLATLLATPCSAPFVGTAVGFALARDSLDVFLVFSCLALGFSTPYLLALVLPLEKIRFPKAGFWMVYVQRFLGVLLAGTVVWLVYLLEHHQNASQFWLTLFSLTFGGFGLLLLPMFPKTGKILSFGSFFLILMLPGVPHWFPSVPFLKDNVSRKVEIVQWHPLEAERIESLVREGKTVFVDLTASWCITCQVNKRLVLQSTVIQNHLQADHVVAMRGDWSKPNRAVSVFLQRFGRAGIPFNVIIGPGAPQGIVLPEILTIETVSRAFQKASGL